MTETLYRQAFKRNPDIANQFPINFDRVCVCVYDKDTFEDIAVRKLNSERFFFEDLGFEFALATHRE